MNAQETLKEEAAIYMPSAAKPQKYVSKRVPPHPLEIWGRIYQAAIITKIKSPKALADTAVEDYMNSRDEFLKKYS